MDSEETKVEGEEVVVAPEVTEETPAEEVAPATEEEVAA
jgi:hypothetical protein